MDGYEVARVWRQQSGMEEVLLVALTGWGQDSDRRRFNEAGFDHHVVKPVEPEALPQVVSPRKGKNVMPRQLFLAGSLGQAILLSAFGLPLSAMTILPVTVPRPEALT